MKIDLFFLGVANSPTHRTYSMNAFVSNILNLMEMLSRYEEYNMTHFGVEGSQLPKKVEHVTVVTEVEMDESYGDNWRTHQGILPAYCDSISRYAYQLFDIRAIYEIKKRVRSDTLTFVLAFFGREHQKVCDALKDTDVVVIEPAVGYDDCFANHRVFPSRAWQNFCYGNFHSNWHAIIDKVPEEDRLYDEYMLSTANPYFMDKTVLDAMIPHAIDLSLFPRKEDIEVGDHFLQCSRVIQEKGVKEAIEATRRMGVKLKIAGCGDFVKHIGFEPPDHVELLGPLEPEARAFEMGRCKANLSYSRYIEMFGYVPLEVNAMCRPSITSDQGAFAETIQDGVNGFRVHGIDGIVQAMQKIDTIDPAMCRAHVENNFSYDALAPRYHAYFQWIAKYVKLPHSAQRELLLPLATC